MAGGPLHLELTSLAKKKSEEEDDHLPETNDVLAEDEDPHASGLGGDLVSAVLGIIKGMVGPAILYLPHGFAFAGWGMAIPIILVATMLFLSSSSCLLESWKLESSKGTFDKLETSEEEMAQPRLESIHRRPAPLSYPELAKRAYGDRGEAAVKIGIALMQSGVCLTYLIFVPQNLHTCTKNLVGVDIPATWFMVVMLLFQIPMSWIRDIRRLTPTNLLANVLILYGLLTCLGFAFATAVQSEADRGPIAEILNKVANLPLFNSGWFLFIGTSVSLYSPEDFSSCHQPQTVSLGAFIRRIHHIGYHFILPILRHHLLDGIWKRS